VCYHTPLRASEGGITVRGSGSHGPGLNWPDSGSYQQTIAKCNKLARSGEEGRRALEADWWRGREVEI
jgi:hypothetical protein